MKWGLGGLRRRRPAAVVAVVVVVVLTVAGVAALVRGEGRSTPTATGPPRRTTTPTATPTATPPARQILYSDRRRLRTPPYNVDDAFHFGDRVIETDTWNVHLDVTDDGFVHTTDDARLWFSDGGRSTQLASGVCGRNWGDESTWIGAYEQDSVMTGNAGSLVAWFDCTSVRRGILVVFDTSVRREVVHQPMSACVRDLGTTPSCRMTAVVGDHVYVTQSTSRAGAPGAMAMLDVTSRRESPVTAQAYSDDLRSQPRALIVGDSPRTGTLSDGVGQTFGVTRSRLVPMSPSTASADRAPVTTSAFQPATGQPVGFHLPPGYHRDDRFTLFEWLDDDTVALAGRDILTCRLSDGRCDLTVRSAHGRERLLPQSILVG